MKRIKDVYGCLTRLFLDRLTPAKLFYYINYTMS